MAKKKADDVSMQSMIVGSLLYGWEHTIHFPSEFIQALREELTAHPYRLKMTTDYTDEECKKSIHDLFAEVGEKVYGKDWETKVTQTLNNTQDYQELIDDEMEELYLPEPEVWKYTIRISLKDVSPTVWRKLEIPSNIRLSHLADYHKTTSKI